MVIGSSRVLQMLPPRDLLWVKEGKYLRANPQYSQEMLPLSSSRREVELFQCRTGYDTLLGFQGLATISVTTQHAILTRAKKQPE